jgi:protein-S-isoprenylcysteine O-methyltransferase Ste14
MKAQTIVRHLIGYFIGIFFFLLAIPYGLYCLSKDACPILLPAGDSLRFVCALILGCVGLVFAFWSNAALLIRGKGGPTDAFNVAISPRTQHLVVTGPYRYTRNPMVFGAFSIYFALALYWNSQSALLVLAAFFIGVHFYLRATEEKRLLRDFGQEYETYRKSVPMIVPRPIRRA